MFIDMLNHHEFERFDLTSLYTGVMAGSPCPIETMRQVINKMNMPCVTVSFTMYVEFVMRAISFEPHLWCNS
jgi:fatty-acyl-CoA synthase